MKGETKKHKEERAKGLKKYKGKKIPRFCVECGEEVGEHESMWTMHDLCRINGVAL